MSRSRSFHVEDLKTVNKKITSTWAVLSVLEKLNIQRAIYIHGDDVDEFVDRHLKLLIDEWGNERIV